MHMLFWNLEYFRYSFERSLFFDFFCQLIHLREEKRKRYHEPKVWLNVYLPIDGVLVCFLQAGGHKMAWFADWIQMLTLILSQSYIGQTGCHFLLLTLFNIVNIRLLSKRHKFPLLLEIKKLGNYSFCYSLTASGVLLKWLTPSGATIVSGQNKVTRPFVSRKYVSSSELK